MVSSVAKSGKKSEFHQFNLPDALPYKDKWSVFGSADLKPNNMTRADGFASA
jgi:hypothetical protein